MLVLTRKVDEQIVIDNQIRVVVLEIRGNKVRIGVEAPNHIPVSRPDAKVKTAKTTE